MKKKKDEEYEKYTNTDDNVSEINCNMSASIYSPRVRKDISNKDILNPINPYIISNEVMKK